jgi:hypothetical protein
MPYRHMYICTHVCKEFARPKNDHLEISTLVFYAYRCKAIRQKLTRASQHVLRNIFLHNGSGANRELQRQRGKNLQSRS